MAVSRLVSFRRHFIIFYDTFSRIVRIRIHSRVDTISLVVQRDNT